MDELLFKECRERMVRAWTRESRITDAQVLKAMGEVPRHAFVRPELQEYAYEDVPLPIEEGQTISQPYIVALMLELLRLRGTERVLEVGTGSGYAAAVLGRLAREVHTVERLPALAASATARLEGLGYGNVHVHHGDGSLGWPEDTPYDAIVVAAGSPAVPRALVDQLAEGGHLVMPLGHGDEQVLIRLRKVGTELIREELEPVRFVPLIGEQGWSTSPGRAIPAVARSRGLPSLVREASEHLEDIETVNLAPLLDRIGNARVVLLGEATHGTSEFYRMRARITRELVLRRGFDVVAVEADWPDASRIDRHVRNLKPSEHRFTAFSRFPTWMWRNQEASDLVAWLRAFNAEVADVNRRVCFFGLDLYSLFTSAAAVITYLKTVDVRAATAAKARYGRLTPWESDPTAYGRAAFLGQTPKVEEEVTEALTDLLRRRLEYARHDGYRFFDAAQNAQLVVDAERYYRAMFRGSRESWNLRDQHMFNTLLAILEERGPASKAIVWAHNSHCGDAAATEMGSRGEFNIGQLARQHFGDDSFHIGFGTDHGTVAAAQDWDEPMEIMRVRPAHQFSHERVFHESSVPALLLPLRLPLHDSVRDEFMRSRLERAIGVVYRPETELQSHYFAALLAQQFDEYIWFDASEALHPLATPTARVGVPETYPFAV